MPKKAKKNNLPQDIKYRLFKLGIKTKEDAVIFFVNEFEFVGKKIVIPGFEEDFRWGEFYNKKDLLISVGTLNVIRAWIGAAPFELDGDGRA